jgi:hypothetical protein
LLHADLRQAVASESSLKSSLQIAYDLSQQELASLENVAIAVC